MKRNVITGASGLLGSHIAEHLVRRGEKVRALVRPSSDTSFLNELGVELVVGDLADRDSVRRAVEGADIVYHCAARVTDWGPWRLFQAETIDATAQLLAVAQEAGVGRFLHLSSISAYGHPPEREGEITEDEPLGQNPWIWDYYGQSKAQAERLVQAAKLPWTVARPGWVYGARDRRMLPRVLNALRAGRVAVVGPGDNLLNILYAGDVADGVVRAANHPAAVGRAYNLTSSGDITQREFLDLLTAELGLPPVKRHLPLRVALAGSFAAEVIGKIIRLGRAPHFTRHGVTLVGRTTRYSTKRAREELGWSPQTPVREGLERALAWQRTHGPDAVKAATGS